MGFLRSLFSVPAREAPQPYTWIEEQPTCTLTLKQWLDGFRMTSGKLSGLTMRGLVGFDETTSFRARDFMQALEQLEQTFDVTYATRTHRRWLHSCTWFDDGMEDSAMTLARMLGLSDLPSEPADRRYFEAYIAGFNRLAEGVTVQRLFIVEGVQRYLVIRLSVDLFEKLTAQHLLFAHAPRLDH